MRQVSILTIPTILLLHMGVAQATEPDSPNGSEFANASPDQTSADPIINGFEIRLPLCSLASMPGKVCKDLVTDKACVLGPDGEPVRQVIGIAQDPLWGAYFSIEQGRFFEWAEGIGIFGFSGNSSRFITCPYASSNAPNDARATHHSQHTGVIGSLGTWRYYGALVSNRYIALPGGRWRDATSAERKAGVTVAYIQGFVNGLAEQPDASYLVRGTVKIGDRLAAVGADPTPLPQPTHKVQLALQTYDTAANDWFDIEVATYQLSSPTIREVESIVPPNTFVRLQVRIINTDGLGVNPSIQDVRLFGAQCYTDEAHEGMCL